MSKKFNMVGQRFGRLIVIEESGKDNCGQIQWKCKCDCGNEVVVRGYQLRSGRTQSCGCLQTERRCNRLTTHGETHTKLYRKWARMKRRCYNTYEKTYKYYGGRGIEVCKEWKSDFSTFRDWALTHGYSDNLELDRINVNGNYKPANCRWVTRKEQANNTRKNRYLTLNGETHTLAEWCEITGLSRGTIRSRLDKCKWSVEDALTKPVKEA